MGNRNNQMQTITKTLAIAAITALTEAKLSKDDREALQDHYNVYDGLNDSKLRCTNWEKMLRASGVEGKGVWPDLRKELCSDKHISFKRFLKIIPDVEEFLDERGLDIPWIKNMIKPYKMSDSEIDELERVWRDNSVKDKRGERKMDKKQWHRTLTKYGIRWSDRYQEKEDIHGKTWYDEKTKCTSQPLKITCEIKKYESPKFGEARWEEKWNNIIFNRFNKWS